MSVFIFCIQVININLCKLLVCCFSYVCAEWSIRHKMNELQWGKTIPDIISINNLKFKNSILLFYKQDFYLLKFKKKVTYSKYLLHARSPTYAVNATKAKAPARIAANWPWTGSEPALFICPWFLWSWNLLNVVLFNLASSVFFTSSSINSASNWGSFNGSCEDVM